MIGYVIMAVVSVISLCGLLFWHDSRTARAARAAIRQREKVAYDAHINVEADRTLQLRAAKAEIKCRQLVVQRAVATGATARVVEMLHLGQLNFVDLQLLSPAEQYDIRWRLNAVYGNAGSTLIADEAAVTAPRPESKPVPEPVPVPMQRRQRLVRIMPKEEDGNT